MGISLVFNKGTTQDIWPFRTQIKEMLHLAKVITMLANVHPDVSKYMTEVQCSRLQLFSLFTKLWVAKRLELDVRWPCHCPEYFDTQLDF